MTTVADILELLRGYEFRCTTESDLGEAVARALTDARVPFEREVPLAKGSRIDFLVAGTIGLELKMSGSGSDIARQLQRYAASDQVTDVVLLTTRLLHEAVFGRLETFGGKPLYVLRLRWGAL